MPRILDFGAGIGTFVRAARERGWDATGVERSRAAVDRAREELGVALLPSLADAPGTYDVITMWDVIEHVRDPEGVARSLHALLRPGGWIVVETGNWESWQRVASGDAWALYLFDHQYYFSPASLETVLTRAGFHGFTLLSARTATPPPEPPPDADAEARARWATYRHASDAWPAHAAIDVMIAGARR